MTSQKKQLTVYYDGACPMCTAFKEHSEGHTKEQNVQFTDVHHATLPDVFTKDEVLTDIRAVDGEEKVLVGAEAIFAVLKQHKWLSWLGRLGSIPIVSKSTQPIYRIIADQRHFIFGALSRLFWIRALVIIGLITGLLLSVPLWLGDRMIPMAPLLQFPFPETVSTALFLLLLPGLLWALVSPKPQRALVASFCSIGLLILIDQNRLQPWVYQYGAMVLILSTYSWNYTDSLGYERILNVFRLMLAGIYFYSGLQKFNPVFISSVFPWMVEPIIPSDLQLIGILLGFCIPFVEMFIGIGLLFKKTRKAALIGAIAMLLFVLYTLGPFGHNWNSVVWPWNIVFAALALLLFWRVDKTLRQICELPRSIISYLVLLCFLLFPLLFFFNKWDSYPSFSLYSGQVPNLIVRVPAEVDAQELQPYVYEAEDGHHYINISQFAMSDIGVPIYPERRIYTVVAESICMVFNGDARVAVQYQPRMYWAMSNAALPIETCEEIVASISTK